jgi:hypothetical protein
LKRGSTCTGTLAPHGSGTPDQPITIGSYGAGSLPVINAGGTEVASIQLNDQQGWHIQELEATGGTKYGIYIGNHTNATLTHFRITNVVVHDVMGETFYRLDGLIYIETEWLQEGIIQDVIVDGANVYNTNLWNGIKIGCTGSMTFPDNLPVIIRNSTVHNVGGDGILILSCSNGLIEHNVAWDTGMVETPTNLPSNSIWTWSCKDCIIQFNEAYRAHSQAEDGGGFGIDYPDVNNILQYNYGHDNDSFCVAVFGSENAGTINSTIRYNICSNNAQEANSPEGSSSRYGDFNLYTWNGGWLDGVAIYNNTIFWNPWDGSASPAFCNGCNPGKIPSFKGTNPNFFMNNIIYSHSANMVFSLDNGGMQLDNNLYWYVEQGNPRFAYGGEAIAEVQRYTSFIKYQEGSGQDWHSQFADPLLIDPTYHTPGMPVGAFRLQPGSPAINAGADLVSLGLVSSMGTQDFFGNPIPAGNYDIGACEMP